MHHDEQIYRTTDDGNVGSAQSHSHSQTRLRQGTPTAINQSSLWPDPHPHREWPQLLVACAINTACVGIPPLARSLRIYVRDKTRPPPACTAQRTAWKYSCSHSLHPLLGHTRASGQSSEASVGTAPNVLLEVLQMQHLTGGSAKVPIQGFGEFEHFVHFEHHHIKEMRVLGSATHAYSAVLSSAERPTRR